MKAVLCSKYGPPEVLQLKEIEKPTPKETELLVKIHATTVNRTDCATLRAKPFLARMVTGLLKPKKPILGTEFAGVIEAIGKKVSTYKVGERIFGLDDMGLGSHAAYLTISEDSALARIPKNITYEQAAASTEGAHYAKNFINKVDLKSEHNVLINGASGGIGSAALQLVKYYGASVTAVCNTKNIDLIKSLGADKVVDYLMEDFTADDQKYNFVFDAVGKSSFAKCKPLLLNGGVYISSELGALAQNHFFSMLTPLFGKKKVKFPLPVNAKESVLLIQKLFEEGKFKAVIDRQYPLEQIVEAFKYVEQGEKTGNVVITVVHNNHT
jgi:NADPH:quinone reductase-like Zn-dependent oxidoreductase